MNSAINQRKQGNRKKNTDTGKKRIVFSFRDFDQNQGQTFGDWEIDKILAKAIDKLRHICNLTLNEAKQQSIIKPYNKVDFPPNSDFYHPNHINKGVTWCTLHVQGKECIIGYFDENIFYIVFLDKNHGFWKT